MLAALLEKAGVSYEVLEKVAEVKPLGKHPKGVFHTLVAQQRKKGVMMQRKVVWN